MNKNRALGIAIGLGLIVGTMAACSSQQSYAPSSESVQEEARLPGTITFYQPLPDGREVLCVWAINYNAGGLSCDWEGLEKSQ